MQPSAQEILKGPRIFFAALFFLGVSVAQAETGGVLVSASIAEPANLIPVLATDSASQSIVGYVFNGLLKYNPQIELEGDLAESWEIRDEGKTIIFHLKRGVTWHDGAPFTAYDVEFTYEKLIDSNVPSPFGGDFKMVQALEVVDDYTVRVSYTESFSPALASWTMWIMPKHLLEHQDLTSSEFARQPIGTGAYRFKRWLTYDRVELIANETYFDGRANIDRIISRMIPDPTTSFLELHQQSVDLLSLNPLQYTRLTQGDYFKDNFQKFRYASFGYTYLGYNLEGRFKDKRVRLALNMAVNKQEIIDGVLLGLGRECTGPFTPESWAFNPDVKSTAFDPEGAKRLLAQAGWKPGQDGVLQRSGERFEFTIITNQGNLQRQQTAEIIQRRLSEIGIVVKIKVIEWSAFLKEVVHKRKYEAFLLGWGLARDPDPFDIWHSSKSKPGEFNFVGFKNSEVDTLIELGRRTFDRVERQAAYRRIHEILYEEQPNMFLYIADALPIIHKRFKKVEATAIGIGYNFNDWEVPAHERKYKRYEP